MMGVHDHRRLRPPAPGHRPRRDRRSGSTRSMRWSTPRASPAPGSWCRKLLERARELQVGTPGRPCPRPTSTRSRREEEPFFPGDEDIERRIRAFIRWNAAVMVVKANKHADGIGGHLATFACSAALYEVGFNHFFRGKDDGLAGDHVYIQGHAAPGIYARAFLEGRLDEDQLDHFRREIGGGGLSSLPAPAAHARLLGVPDGVDGPRPASTRSTRPASTSTSTTAASTTPAESRVWCFIGDGECDEPETLGSISLAGREGSTTSLGRQLQPAAPRRPGPRQRQDHPGARGRVPRRRAGTSSRSSGAGSGTSCSPATSTACCSTR